MAIELPDDWPPSGWAEVPPLAHLETITESAPSGAIPTRWRVANWGSTREIKSTSLPGQVRHSSGLSVGTGKALLKRDGNDYPWKKGLVYDLSGQDAQILLGPEGGGEIPTGQFRVAEVSGDLTSLGVQVELDEKQIEGNDSTANVLGEQGVSGQQIDDIYFDPIWLVEQLAHQMGYGVGVRPGEPLPNGTIYSPIMDIPYQGSMIPVQPRQLDFTEYSAGEGAFGELGDEGLVGLTSREGNGYARVEYLMDSPIPATATYTFDLIGRTRIAWVSGFSQAWFRVTSRYLSDEPNRILLEVGSTGANGTTNALAFLSITNMPVPEDRPSGLQVQFEVTTTQARARIRREPGAAWSAWVTNTITNALTTDPTYKIDVQSLRYDPGLDDPEINSVLARLSIVDTAVAAGSEDALLSNTQGTGGRIFLEPLYGTSLSPWLDPDLTVWNTMQAIVAAWQGALITDVYGNLRVMNRYTLTGVGTGAEMPIDVGLRFEDVPWQMDYTDQADRLVVKYRPVVERKVEPTDTRAFMIYEFQEVIVTNPGRNNDQFFTLDYIYPLDLQLLQFVRKDFDNGIQHVWDAYRYNNGTGAHMDPTTDIQMRIDRVTSSTWKVFIVNLTSSPFYMVDSSGTPWLKIRSTWYFDQTQETTVERGLPASQARNAMEIDLGHYVQNEEDANALADFIWGRVRQRSWRAATINAIPDYRLDLGDVVELRHERTSMKSNALVTKVDLAGEPGQVTQKIDLVLIPPTWEDFDEAWSGPSGGTWDDFDALWAPYTWNDFDRTPTATTVAEIEEAL